MSDLRVSLAVEAVTDDAVRDVDAAVKKLNQLEQIEEKQARRQERLNRLSSESARLAREIRTVRDREVSTEDRLIRLKERRAQVEDRLTRAHGNELRTLALRTRLQQIELAQARLGGTSASGGGFFSGLASRFGFGGGGLGMIAGGAAASGAIASLYTAIRGITSTLRLVDNISDSADQLGISRTQMLGLQSASARSGVRSGTLGRSLSTFAQARSSALSGDPTLLRVFGNYGVTQADLGSQLTNVDLMRRVAKSLGAGGMTPSDAGPLGRLFGQQPGRMLSLLGQYQEAPGMQDALGRVDRLNSAIEQLTQSVKELSIRMLSTWEKTFPAVLGVLAAVFPSVRQTLNTASLIASNVAPSARSAELVGPPIPPGPRTAGNPIGLLNNTPTAKQRASLVMSSDELAKRGFYLGTNTSDQRRAIALMEQQLAAARQQVAQLQTLNSDE